MNEENKKKLKIFLSSIILVIFCFAIAFAYQSYVLIPSVDEKYNTEFHEFKEYIEENNISNQNQQLFFKNREVWKKYLNIGDLNESQVIKELCHSETYGFVGCTATCVSYGSVPYIYECYSDFISRVGNNSAMGLHYAVYNYDAKYDSILKIRWYGILRFDEEGNWIIRENVSFSDPNILE